MTQHAIANKHQLSVVNTLSATTNNNNDNQRCVYFRAVSAIVSRPNRRITAFQLFPRSRFNLPPIYTPEKERTQGFETNLQDQCPGQSLSKKLVWLALACLNFFSPPDTVWKHWFIFFTSGCIQCSGTRRRGEKTEGLLFKHWTQSKVVHMRGACPVFVHLTHKLGSGWGKKKEKKSF